MSIRLLMYGILTVAHVLMRYLGLSADEVVAGLAKRRRTDGGSQE